MAHSQGYRDMDVPLTVWEEHHYRYRAPPAERRGQVDAQDLSGIGQHLLSELPDGPGAYPHDLEINAESTGDELTAQPYRNSGSSITPIAPPPTRSATPEPPTTPRGYTAHNNGYITRISMPIRSPPFQGQSAQITRPVRDRRLGNFERQSIATYSDTALESTFSHHHRSYPPSRTTYNASQEDVANFADVEDNSERVPTAYQPSHTTPSHHSMGTREDLNNEQYDYYPDQSPQSEHPYTGVWSHNGDHVRTTIEDYERYHGHRR